MSEFLPTPSEQDLNWQAPETGSLPESTAANESEQTKSDGEEYAETYDAVMTLAQEDIPEEQAVTMISQLLKEQLDNQNRYFPHLINELDPDAYSSNSKLTSDRARERLRQAIELLGKQSS